MRDESWEAWIVEVCDELDINKDDLPMMLNRIQSSGLIEPVVVGTDEGGMWVFTDGVPYRVTSSFKRMMKFLGY